MNQLNIFTNNNQEEENSDEEGVISRTGKTISSFFSTIKNSINPFKRKSYTQNPYDLYSSNDPIHYINSQNQNQNYSFTQNNNNNYQNPINQKNNLNINNNNFESNSFTQNYNNDCQKPINQINSALNNNYFESNQNNNIINNEEPNEEDSYFSMENIFTIFPNIKNEIFKDFKRPIYMPNENFFQEAKKFVYENLVKKYKILKPKTNINNFIEKAIILSIQLINKQNIDMHYDFLVNKKNCNYKFA